MEVPGPDHGLKADALASRMREVLARKEGVRVNRPEKTAEIRVSGLEGSITPEEAAEAIATKGACRQSEITIGDIRETVPGQRSFWARLPLIAAKKASEGGHINIGWSRACVVLLDARPLRCFKCLAKGHTRETCLGSEDRSDWCYRCGESGHVARSCATPPRCPICADIGRKADHVLGGKDCASPPKRTKGGANSGAGGRQSKPPSQQAPPATGGAAAEVPKPQCKGRTPTRKSTPFRAPRRRSPWRSRPWRR